MKTGPFFVPHPFTYISSASLSIFNSNLITLSLKFRVKSFCGSQRFRRVKSKLPKEQGTIEINQMNKSAALVELPSLSIPSHPLGCPTSTNFKSPINCLSSHIKLSISLLFTLPSAASYPAFVIEMPTSDEERKATLAKIEKVAAKKAQKEKKDDELEYRKFFP